MILLNCSVIMALLKISSNSGGYRAARGMMELVGHPVGPPRLPTEPLTSEELNILKVAMVSGSTLLSTNCGIVRLDVLIQDCTPFFCAILHWFGVEVAHIIFGFQTSISTIPRIYLRLFSWCRRRSARARRDAARARGSCAR